MAQEKARPNPKLLIFAFSTWSLTKHRSFFKSKSHNRSPPSLSLAETDWLFNGNIAREINFKKRKEKK
jgi:hypothetical protein